jgi:cytosine/adenosine deaminase-related metal-dependent hydrolase
VTEDSRVLTVIRDTTIVTGDAARHIIFDGAIAVEGRRIAAVGPTTDVLPRFPGAACIDGRGKAVFPGLVNCHTHLCLTAMRGIQEDFGFPSVLRFPTTVRAFMSTEENAVLATLGAIEAIRSGTTCLLEIGRDVAGYADALTETGLGLVLAEITTDIEPEAVRQGRFMYSPALGEAGLRRTADLISRWHGAGEGLVTCAVSPLAPESCSPDHLRGARELAQAAGVPCTIHLNQSRWEVDAVLQIRGLRPTEYLSRAGFLGPGVIAAHCRFMEPAEVALLGRSGATVAHSSAMAARRGSMPPITALAAAGCTIALGTDNMAEDMVEAVRTAMFLERVARQDALYPGPDDVLEWATRNGARALARPRSGSLEIGHQADLFVVDTRHANLTPSLRVQSAFVHNGQPRNIEAVMVAGQWLMRDAKLLTVDESEVVRQAEEISLRAWHRLVEQYPEVAFPILLPPRRGN